MPITNMKKGNLPQNKETKFVGNGGIMAIQDSFSISEARMNQAYAYKCWYNYNYENNTMGIPSSAMGEIVTQYSGVMKDWKATATNDENKYEISEDNFSDSYDAGKQRGKDSSGGHDGSTDGTGSAVASTVNVVGGVAAGVMGVLTSITALSGKAALTKPGAITLSGTVAAAVIGGALAASGTYLVAAKPNKDPADACEQLTQDMGTAQSEIMEQDSIMEDADGELIELADEADSANENTNAEMEENKSEFDLYKESYDNLVAKLESGEELTEEEKELLKELIPLMQQLGVNIEELQGDATDYISELYESMEEYQEYFDDAAEKIAEIQGMTDFAAAFDEATKENANMVKTTATVGTVGAGAIVTAGAIGIKAGKAKMATVFGAGYGAAQVAAGITATALGVAAGVEFQVAAKQQSEYADKASIEIDARVATQDLNSTLNDVYDERVEDFEGYMGIVEDLELEVPDDMEAPEETPTIPEGEAGETAGSETGSGTDNGNTAGATTGASKNTGAANNNGGATGNTSSATTTPKPEDKDKDEK